jgi:gamma-glutamyltranspeptidase / glutathione hydrolase
VRLVKALGAFALSALLMSCTAVETASAPAASASLQVTAPRPGLTAEPAMIAAANPLAVEAGLSILRSGGNAMDAAIAVQAMLGLVEPQSSGIGGGAFILVYDASKGSVTSYDGREIAPMTARADMFLGPDGKPLGFFDAAKSGHSIGVPGVIAVLKLAYDDLGGTKWAEAFAPAIAAAEKGFPVSPRLSTVIGEVMGMTTLAPDAAAYLTRDGKPLAAGTILANPAYAKTLAAVAKDPRAFYEGEIARAIVASANLAPGPSGLTLSEIEGYEARRLAPVCGPYRARRVCSMGPPSSGGIAVGAILGLLQTFDMAKTGPTTVLGWHLFIEAQRLAYADRDKYVADDRFVSVPVAGLLDAAYLASRAALIDPKKAAETVEAGTPPGAPQAALGIGTDTEYGTSHFVVADRFGNVVAMTTTVEGPFGSQRMAAGFFLNNQLTDFSFKPVDDAGKPVANAAAPGKKPRSSMAPTIVFDGDTWRVAAGSPGGNAIIAYVAKTLIGVMDWGLTPQQAADLPNVIARNQIVAEAARFDPKIRAALEKMGHVFREGRGGENSGIHLIVKNADGTLSGGADSRREGVARGP